MVLYQELWDSPGAVSAHRAGRLGLFMELQIQSEPSSGCKTANFQSNHDLEAASLHTYRRALE